jgi:hypothetical protein
LRGILPCGAFDLDFSLQLDFWFLNGWFKLWQNLFIANFSSNNCFIINLVNEGMKTKKNKEKESEKNKSTEVWLDDLR